MGASSIRISAIVAAATALLTVSACTGSGTDSPKRQTTPPSVDLCQDAVAEGCHQITVGGRAYRYYLSGATAGTTAPSSALLVDMGGPGLSLSSVLPPNYNTAFRADLGALADGKRLLLLEEPWVTGNTDTTCPTSSGEFYAWMRRNWKTTTPATIPPVRCPWGQGRYGWNRQTYRAVLTAEHLTTVDMAALSFGAVRYSYVDDLVATAALARPAAAPGTPSADVVEARTNQVWKELTARCHGCTPGQGEKRRREVAGHLPRNRQGVAEAQRPRHRLRRSERFCRRGDQHFH